MATFVVLMDYAIRYEMGTASESPGVIVGWLAGWLAWCLPFLVRGRWAPFLSGAGLLLFVGRLGWLSVIGLTLMMSALLRSELTPTLRWWLAGWKATWLALWLVNLLAHPIMGAPAGVAAGAALGTVMLLVIGAVAASDPGRRGR